MNVTSRVLGLCGLLIVQCVLSSCIASSHETKVGVELDEARIGEIKPGTTTFSEILEWFGPPDYIIDGTQQIYDTVSATGGPEIPTRVFTAPPGMVICIYVRSRYQGSGAVSMVPIMGLDGASYRFSARANELFVYISKQDRRVIEFIVGSGDGGGASG